MAGSSQDWSDELQCTAAMIFAGSVEATLQGRDQLTWVQTAEKQPESPSVPTTLMQKAKEYLRKWAEKLHASQHSNHHVALGFAIGTFLNITIPVISFVLAFVIMFLFRKLSKISIIVALAFWNPITLAPVYFLSYGITKLVFGNLPPFSYHLFSPHELLTLSKDLLLGNLAIGVLVSLFSYSAVRLMITWYRNRKQRQLSDQH